MRFDFIQIPEANPSEIVKRVNAAFRRIGMMLDGVNRDGNNLVLDVPLVLESLTTAERDALAAVTNGMLIYNTTIPAVQARVGGAWVNL